jgi:hypothetical protein
MRERKRLYTRPVGAWLGCVIAAGAMIWPSTGSAKEILFEAPGLLESVEEGGLRISRPIRITIAPDETEQIVVDSSRITSDALTEGKPFTYRFYCPLHRADDDMGGSITVMK